MEKVRNLIITISRQRGCGGAEVGQRLAKSLGITYVDRQIVEDAAKRLSIPVEVVESHDEKVTSLWKSIVEAMALSNVYAYSPPPLFLQDDKTVQDQEAAIIQHIAESDSAVIVGRCACNTLRGHPSHVSIYLHAPVAYRTRRLQTVYNISAQEAASIIEQTDRERSQYVRSCTNRDMNDSSQYDLAIDTGILGLERTQWLIEDYIRARFD